jgi:ATP-binding cassette subfamily F protein 3
VLGRNQPKADAKPKGEKRDRKAAAEARELARQAAREVSDAEAAIARWQKQLSAIDQAMFAPASAAKELRDLTMGELSRRRGEVLRELELAEQQWLIASERLENQSA